MLLLCMFTWSCGWSTLSGALTRVLFTQPIFTVLKHPCLKIFLSGYACLLPRLEKSWTWGQSLQIKYFSTADCLSSGSYSVYITVIKQEFSMGWFKLWLLKLKVPEEFSLFIVKIIDVCGRSGKGLFLSVVQSSSTAIPFSESWE